VYRDIHTFVRKSTQNPAILTDMPQGNMDEHNEMLRLLRENNQLLKKLYRHNVIGFTFRIIWYAILLGMPFALYFYVLGPYFDAFGANYEVFRKGMAEIPGLKGLENLLPPVGQ
jgi:hypothetical protein